MVFGTELLAFETDFLDFGTEILAFASQRSSLPAELLAFFSDLLIDFTFLDASRSINNSLYGEDVRIAADSHFRLRVRAFEIFGGVMSCFSICKADMSDSSRVGA